LPQHSVQLQYQHQKEKKKTYSKDNLFFYLLDNSGKIKKS